MSEDEAAADAEKAFEDSEQCLSDLGIDSGLFISGGPGDGAAVEIEADEDGVGSDEPFGGITPEQIEQMQQECEPLLADIDNGFDLSPERRPSSAMRS